MSDLDTSKEEITPEKPKGKRARKEQIEGGVSYEDVNFEVTSDDPGIFIEWSSDVDIHNAMAIAPALPGGLVLGGNAAASAAAMKQW